MNAKKIGFMKYLPKQKQIMEQLNVKIFRNYRHIENKKLL